MYERFKEFLAIDEYRYTYALRVDAHWYVAVGNWYQDHIMDVLEKIDDGVYTITEISFYDNDTVRVNLERSTDNA